MTKQPLFNALAIFIAGAVLTGAFLAHLHQSEHSFRQARFQAYVDKTTKLLHERLLSYEHGLQGLRAAFLTVGADAMTLETFRQISQSRDPDREFPGTRGFGFIQRVAPGDEAAFVQAMQAKGRADFAIKQLAPHAGDRFVITFIEPEARNREAVGLDVGSEANRRGALVSAFRTGKATLSHPITLVQADGKVGRGFMLALPYYPGHQLPADAAAREAAAWGATYSPLVIDEVLAGFDMAADGVGLSLTDVDAAAEPFYAPAGASAPAADGLVATRQITLFGRTWQAAYRAQPAFVAALPQGNPLAIAVLGLVASSLLALLRFQEMRNRARLRQSALRLRLFVNNAPVALAMFDTQMCYLAVSARWCEDFGLTADALEGRSHYELFPEISDEWRAFHRRALAGEVIRAERDAFHRADGRVQWLKWEIRPWHDTDGAIGGIVIVSEDVTYTRQVEQEIRHLNATLEAQVAERTAELEVARRSLRMVLDGVPSMIGYWDKHLINKVANHAYADWFGVNADEIPGKTIRELLGERLYELNRPRIEAALEGEPQTFERTLERPDGKGSRHALAHYLPDIVDGEVQGFFVVVHDITELTESRERMAALLRENQLLLTSIDRQLIYSVTDADGHITHVNDIFCETSGYPREALLGKDHRLLNSGVHDRAFWAEMWAELQAGRAWRADICNRARDGRLFWVDTVVAPLTDDNGQVERIVALRYDVTESKQAVRALEIAKKQAERANIAKSAFLANTSHEIRTPLNVVSGMAYLLGQSTLDAEQREQVLAIQTASRTLLELINDVLDLAKIEAGEMVYDMRPFALDAVMADTERLFRAQAELKGLDYRAAPLPETVPAALVGDALRLRQVLNNLIGNAVKFSEQGHVAVDVQPLGDAPVDSADVLWLRFEVSDTGCGMDEAAQGRLFSPFVQADTSITRRHGGSGLGLSIVRQLVEGMGGRVGADSAAGVGSTFWFELPFGRSLMRRPPPPGACERRALEALTAAEEYYPRGRSIGQ
ncbi:MAG: PAS domain S-box protein, partial [Proteobacteria bacterium]